MAPPPRPSGMAIRQSTMNLLANEMPISALAVRSTQNAVTAPVPNFRITRTETRLEMTVPTVMKIEISPAYETGAPSCA